MTLNSCNELQKAVAGYDSSMRSWGGENIDQSLRTWLCGGEIVYAEGSRVAPFGCIWSAALDF